MSIFSVHAYMYNNKIYILQKHHTIKLKSHLNTVLLCLSMQYCVYYNWQMQVDYPFNHAKSVLMTLSMSTFHSEIGSPGKLILILTLPTREPNPPPYKIICDLSTFHQLWNTIWERFPGWPCASYKLAKTSGRVEGVVLTPKHTISE